MSNRQRIAELEARVSALSERLAAVEGRYTFTVTQPSVGAWPLQSCQYCGLPFSMCKGHNICYTGADPISANTDLA